jgi:hypothetical protein
MSFIATAGLVPSFFVAYTQRDERVAKYVCKLLGEDMGFDVYSMDDNPYGTDYKTRGEGELARRTCLVPIVGKEESRWLDQEVHDALVPTWVRESCVRVPRPPDSRTHNPILESRCVADPLC